MANVIGFKGQGVQATNPTAATTLLVKYPTTTDLGTALVAGDLMLVEVVSSNATAPSVPTGFLTLGNTNSGGSSPSIRKAYRFVTAADVTHSTNGDSLTCPTSSSTSFGRIKVYTAVDQAVTIDVAASVFSSSASVVNYDMSLTTDRPGCLLDYTTAGNAAVATWTQPSVPAAFTEDNDVHTTTPEYSSGHLIWSGSGATGTVRVVLSSTARGCGILVALIPQNAGTTRTTTWNTKASVSLTRPTTWNVLTQVAAVTRATTWRVLAAVSPSRLTTWNTKAQTSTSRATTWRALTTVGTTRLTTWRTLATAATSRLTTWRTLAAAAASRLTTWRVLKSVSATRQTTWNIAGRVVKTITTTWNTKAQVTLTRPTTWKVLTSVGKSVTTTWRTLAPAGVTRLTSWNLKQAITVVRSTTWNLKGRVTIARAITWRVLTRVATNRKTYWNVAVLPPLVPNPQSVIGHNGHTATLVANQHTGAAVDAVGQGDTLTAWQCVLSNGSVPYDATGADSVTVKGYRNDTLLIDRAPTSVDADGTVTLDWVDGETDDPGPIKFKVIVTKSGFKPATFPPQGWMVTKVHPSAP